MPELPDILLYRERLAARVVGHPLQRVRLGSPFLLRSVEPPLQDALGREVVAISRMGKRIVFELRGDFFLVIHLMIAGRFKWFDNVGAKIPGKIGLAAFDFDVGTLIMTEASSKKRASLHVVHGRAALDAFSRGGLDVMRAKLPVFAAVLRRENHTLKRSLTDPRLVDGIGNAYSDEILHHAQLSPVKLTSKLTDEEIARLFHSTQTTLRFWIDKLAADNPGFPAKVTAFVAGMAVHGRYGEPCPRCGKKVQRIRYAENETNYCATCQTGGKLLADRGLSRLLHGDWPKNLDELEDMKTAAREQLKK